ncbi:DUF302 domain-containing protein [Mycolicibacterium brisbanense]|uniref:DUF302 domain-containing protein n=1 Tax=Mycolicibacterium brisbanense TaxID=146020 RepID=A0A100VWT7_9MYCO|nr:DUF302 domain-containing protein [Mycolicibacterium brisbanense]MCV7161552.1 DUF302 domain-containing protein [Mycolicibacterium brisbanense]GAS87474.1 putative uncharacterized protein [Mycolicibacterium brisbanense]
MHTNGFDEVRHEVVRWSIDTGSPFDDFQARYEAAVPALDLERMAHFRAGHSSWDAVLADVVDSAPHGFLRFWSTDVGGLMRIAGHHGACATYLMGNHTIAERMYRHDPTVMLYAPLRTTIHEDRYGSTRFSIDRPSSRFASFGDPDIAAVGLELDQKVVNLLRVLDVPVPATATAGLFQD